jgi:hypothetical protein
LETADVAIAACLGRLYLCRDSCLLVAESVVVESDCVAARALRVVRETATVMAA